jgi:uncharacterized protein (DUF58 family)
MTGTAAVSYRLRWRPGGAYAGAHAGSLEGGGGAFRHHVPLHRYPDPRRIDLRVTLRDPVGEVYVRQFTQRVAIDVVALVDLSGSMRFDGRVHRMQVAAKLCAVLAASARQMGDRFGLIGCDARVREDLVIWPTRRRGLEAEVASRLFRAEPRGASARGLIEGARLLPARRSLVFLISDFLLPLNEIHELLDALSRHDVVPVVLQDQTETLHLPRWGLIELRDLETGRRRLAVMHPRLQAALQSARRWRRAALERCFRRHRCAAFRLVDDLDVDALGEFLLAR